MPSSVANAVATETMPFTLCRAYRHSREVLLRENNYANGENQRDKLVSTSRKRWQLTKRLTLADMQELRTFYDARGGPLEAFYFYDAWETSPKFSYDETGVATTGRYTVRFEGEWNQQQSIARGEVGLSLVELA